MIVFGHLRGLIVMGLISDSPAGVGSVFAPGFDGLPPHFQSLLVLPEVLGRPVIVLQVLVPAQDGESLFDRDLEVPSDVCYAFTTSGVEDSEVSGLSGSADESDPAAALCEFFASPASEM